MPGYYQCNLQISGKNTRGRDFNYHVHWYCRICNTIVVKIITLVAKISKKHDQLDMQVHEHECRINAINEKVGSREDEIDILRSTLSTRETHITSIKHEHKTKLTEIAADIHCHVEKIKAMESTCNCMINCPIENESEATDSCITENRGTGTHIANEMIRSVSERMERQHNIVVFNVPESNSSLKEEMNKHDDVFIQDLSRCLIDKTYGVQSKVLAKGSK